MDRGVRHSAGLGLGHSSPGKRCREVKAWVNEVDDACETESKMDHPQKTFNAPNVEPHFENDARHYDTRAARIGIVTRFGHISTGASIPSPKNGPGVALKRQVFDTSEPWEEETSSTFCHMTGYLEAKPRASLDLAGTDIMKPTLGRSKRRRLSCHSRFPRCRYCMSALLSSTKPTTFLDLLFFIKNLCGEGELSLWKNRTCSEPRCEWSGVFERAR